MALERFPVDGPAWYDDWFDAMRGRSRHRAQDLFAKRWTPVVAPERMRVIRVAVGDRAGLYVTARAPQADGSQRVHHFSHLQTAWAKPGQWLAPGEPFAQVGDSGNASGTRPHLHFSTTRWSGGRYIEHENTFAELTALQPSTASGITEAPSEEGPEPTILDGPPDPLPSGDGGGCE